MATPRKGYYAFVRDSIPAKITEHSDYHYGPTLLQNGGLAIDSTPEKFQTAQALYWKRVGIQFTKAATAAIDFSAAHPVTASKFGAILVQLHTTTGAITTKIVGATQTTTQAYTSGALAVAALPAPDTGNIKIGHIIIEADSGGWTAITDDLTDASDLVTATFVDAAAASVPDAL